MLVRFPSRDHSITPFRTSDAHKHGQEEGRVDAVFCISAYYDACLHVHDSVTAGACIMHVDVCYVAHYIIGLYCGAWCPV